MRDLGQEVRDMVSALDRKEKLFFGGPPFSSEINREIENYDSYLRTGLPPRKRVCLGTCALDTNGKTIGYVSTTIMNNANPTKYERQQIKPTFPINYIQCKKIVVDKEYFGKGIAQELLAVSLDLAKTHKKKWVADVNAENIAVQRFLEKQNIQKQFHWYTPNGTKMYRLGN